MKKYQIQTVVEAASGTQLWSVVAESEAEALAKFKQGLGEFVEEEVEVTQLGEPHVIGVEDVEE